MTGYFCVQYRCVPSAMKNACSCFSPCDRICFPAGNSFKEVNNRIIYKLSIQQNSTIESYDSIIESLNPEIG